MKKKVIHQPTIMKELGEFTEKVLLPAVEDIMDDKLDKRFAEEREFTNKKFMEMRDYIDKRLVETEERIIKRIFKERKKQTDLLLAITGILKKSKLVAKDDILKLQILEQELMAMA